ncbi:hypothetical protein DFJ73DRAFT_957268, partial [Zopfochytrium polystomum]
MPTDWSDDIDDSARSPIGERGADAAKAVAGASGVDGMPPGAHRGLAASSSSSSWTLSAAGSARFFSSATTAAAAGSSNMPLPLSQQRLGVAVSATGSPPAGPSAATSAGAAAARKKTPWRNHQNLVNNVYPGGGGGSSLVSTRHRAAAGKGSRLAPATVSGLLQQQGSTASIPASVFDEVVEDVADADGDGSKPKPSALSLLTFYATSKPHKLVKIGLCLKKRVEKAVDVARCNTGDVKVTFKIIEALTDACSIQINIMAADILRILLLVFEHLAWDLGVVERAAITFAKFASVQGVGVILDPECKSLLDAITLKFCLFARNNGMDPRQRQRLRIIGLQSLGITIVLRRASLSHSLEILEAIVLNLRECLTGSAALAASHGQITTAKTNFSSVPPSLERVRTAANDCLKRLLTHGATSTTMAAAGAAAAGAASPTTPTSGASEKHRYKKQSKRTAAAAASPTTSSPTSALPPAAATTGTTATQHHAHQRLDHQSLIDALIDAVLRQPHARDAAGASGAAPTAARASPPPPTHALLLRVFGTLVECLPPLMHASVVAGVSRRVVDAATAASAAGEDAGDGGSTATDAVVGLLKVLARLAGGDGDRAEDGGEDVDGGGGGGRHGEPKAREKEGTDAAAGAVSLELNSVLNAVVFAVSKCGGCSECRKFLAQWRPRRKWRRRGDCGCGGGDEAAAAVAVGAGSGGSGQGSSSMGSIAWKKNSGRSSVGGVRGGMVVRRVGASHFDSGSGSGTRMLGGTGRSAPIAGLPWSDLVTTLCPFLDHESPDVRLRSAQAISLLFLQEAQEHPPAAADDLEVGHDAVTATVATAIAVDGATVVQGRKGSLATTTSAAAASGSAGGFDLPSNQNMQRNGSIKSRRTSARPGSLRGGVATLSSEAADAIALFQLSGRAGRMCAAQWALPDDIASSFALATAATNMAGLCVLGDFVASFLKAQDSLAARQEDHSWLRQRLTLGLRKYLAWAGASFRSPVVADLARQGLARQEPQKEPSPSPEGVGQDSLERSATRAESGNATSAHSLTDLLHSFLAARLPHPGAAPTQYNHPPSWPAEWRPEAAAFPMAEALAPVPDVVEVEASAVAAAATARKAVRGDAGGLSGGGVETYANDTPGAGSLLSIESLSKSQGALAEGRKASVKGSSSGSRKGITRSATTVSSLQRLRPTTGEKKGGSVLLEAVEDKPSTPTPSDAASSAPRTPSVTTAATVRQMIKSLSLSSRPHSRAASAAAGTAAAGTGTVTGAGSGGMRTAT